MVNKLKTLAVLGGGWVVLLAGWGVIRYPNAPFGFLEVAVFGGIIASLPWTIAYLKLFIHQAYWSVKNKWSESVERGEIFVSKTSISNRESVLDDIASAIRSGVPNASVSDEEFNEGRGLSITFAGFHNTFVRVDKKNRVVLTGASKKVKELTDHLESNDLLSFEQSYVNPFVGPLWVKGAFRVFLGVAIIGLIIAGTAGAANTAYPADAYNPGEKIVLLSFDLRATIDPGQTVTQTQLDKAEFYVVILEEEAIEISWDAAAEASVHASEALQTSSDARNQLDAAKSSSLSPSQADRANRIEQRLHAAERDVSDALEQKMAENETADRSEVLSNASALKEAANRSVG